MAILRAKRIKDIQFQTPVVPTVVLQPAQAVGDYPGTDEQPPNPLGTHAPKNFFKCLAKSIKNVTTTVGTITEDEVIYTADSNEYIHQIFPPEQMYSYNGESVKPYVHSRSDRLKTVDLAMLGIMDYNVYSSDPTYTEGDYLGTNVAGVFSADDYQYYWYQFGSGNGAPTLSGSDDIGILEYGDVLYDTPYQMLASAQQPFGVNATTFMDYDKLDRSPTVEGTPAIAQRSGLIITTEAKEDISLRSVNGTATGFTVFTSNQFGNGVNSGYIAGSDATLHDNTFILGQGDNAAVVEICNVARGLEDDRYGDDDEQHEVIFTGAYHPLTASEVSSNSWILFQVYGGDCFITKHNFKVSDTQYVVADETRAPSGGAGDNQATQEAKGFEWIDNGGTAQTMRPIPLSGAAQWISMFLESETNGFLIERTGPTNSSDGETVEPTHGDGRVDMGYYYSPDYSFNNDTKIWIPKDDIELNQLEFPARVAFSDINIQLRYRRL